MTKCSNKLFSHTESQDSFPWEIHSDSFDNLATKLAPFISINVLCSRPLHIQAWRGNHEIIPCKQTSPSRLACMACFISALPAVSKREKHNQSIKNVIKVPSEARFKSLKMHYSFSPPHREVWLLKGFNNGPSLSCDPFFRCWEGSNQNHSLGVILVQHTNKKRFIPFN